ncbi:MAG TPA: PmoA family protein [Chitinophagaceae bacterium]|nr:PmoA family protein [Chitinophagaceae bacterium]
MNAKKRKYFLLLLFSMVLFTNSHAQKIATLEVELTKSANGVNVPVSTNLDAITFLPDSVLNLVKVNGNKRIPVAFQISEGKERMLTWMIQPGKNTTEKIIFELVKGMPSAFPTINATMNDGALTIHTGEKNLLRYMYKTVYPPAGIDTAFKRSAFIHPLWTPHGQVLTRIQAPDHYHHYGLWNPWTHVLFEGDILDFWNLKDRKGTVRFGNFVSVTSGDVYAEFQAVHQHIAFKSDGTEKVALNELQTVRVYKPVNNEDYYITDITIEMNCASESPFLILEYRYAGLGWRATEKWNKDNSEVITSEGKNRKEADGSTARWCIVQGALDNDYGGAVMMSYPSNYNHPEPMRIWPEDSNKVGELFAMFAPTKNKNWLLMPGKTYTLKYRFVVFNGHFNKEKAESAWQYYSAPAKVTVK